jgi:CBS domain-containing protein
MSQHIVGEEHTRIHGEMDIPQGSTVEDIMIEDVKTVDWETSVKECSEIMTKNKIGGVIVLNAIQDAVGIFTERDLMNRVISGGKGLDVKVKDVMTPDFVCVQLKDSLVDIPKIMLDGGFRHLPVVDGHKVVGILEIRDILNFLISD